MAKAIASRRRQSSSPALRIENHLLKNGVVDRITVLTDQIADVASCRAAVGNHLDVARDTSAAMCLIPTQRVPHAFLAAEFELRVTACMGERQMVLWSSLEHEKDPNEAIERLLNTAFTARPAIVKPEMPRAA